MKCVQCGKIPLYGHNVSHSKRHTNRDWIPNIHRVTVLENGKKKHITLCTRCIRTLAKPSREVSPGIV